MTRINTQMNQYRFLDHGHSKGNGQTRQAFAIARHLQKWMDDRYKAPAGSTQTHIPQVSVSVSRDVIEVWVDDFTVYCSESSSEDKFTFEACLNEFIRQVKDYSLGLPQAKP